MDIGSAIELRAKRVIAASGFVFGFRRLGGNGGRMAVKRSGGVSAMPFAIFLQRTPNNA